ncbi:tyrosyl-tRNA synthetase [Neolewinella xylanilytica]|uniref:Tyrosine--tRNA ligase n=1 Tax=Neolewinella xylanilytica TaxID=1514080 RepID=A0A2S6IAK4_9BACT|nr:tyrosine--tRNA ligase [Neolewinella xylanilytica]PPK88537.1 tyrosyl-tRNA synthetase [Neolewinella xylanilytica]
MDFIAELEWRGMLHQLTPGIREHLQEAPRRGYIGFDPTAPSLTIGNYVQVMLLLHWMRAGHEAVVLFGGATGRIGDPSFKEQERDLKTYDELDRNLAHQQEQMQRLFARGTRAPGAGATAVAEAGKQPTIVNNLDFYKDMNVLDFLRLVGKTLTVSYMLSKDSVQTRLETGLSFTEFSYQLLQGYDFQKLFRERGVSVQMGGSDQWGNITSGTEFVRRNLEEKAYAVTTPLLTKADGSKFGKSAEGNIWLDPELTSPYDFYQFWLRTDDADVAKYLKYFSLRDREAILADCATVDAHLGGEDRYREVTEIKTALAAELTERIHGEGGLQTAQRVTNLLWGRGATPEDLQALDSQAFRALSGNIPTFSVDRAILPVALVDLLSDHSDVTASKSEARRAIQGNAIAVNKEKIGEAEAEVAATDLLHDRYLMVENGKKKRYLFQFQ